MVLGLILTYSKPVYAQQASPAEEVTNTGTTFLFSFVIGVAGAFVYVFLLLMTDRTLSLFQNELLPLPIMALLFIISGGIVAGVTQTSTGSGISANYIQTVFMVGFGWQGVISGAGGSSKLGELKENEAEFKKLLEELSGGE